MDEVAKDAKRLLLRYGAPISVVDQLPEPDRISYARSVVRTSLSDRPLVGDPAVQLYEGGWLDQG